MKRSEINNAIEYVIEKCKDFKLPLPPFAYWYYVKKKDL